MRRFLRTITILSVLPLSNFCGCCSSLLPRQASASDTCRTSPGSPSSASDTAQNCCYVLEIQGMDCPSCVAHIEKALKQVPGVAKAKVDFRSALAKVEPKPGARLTAGALVNAVERTGYRAKVKRQPQS